MSDLLRHKAMELLRREQEVYVLRRAGERTSHWLRVHHELALSIGPDHTRSLVDRWATRLVDDLYFQTAAAWRIDPSAPRLELVGGVSNRDLEPQRHLPAMLGPFLQEHPEGSSEACVDAQLAAALVSALGLGQAFWTALRQEGVGHLLFAAGFDPATPPCASPVPAEEVRWFAMVARHLALTIANARLHEELTRRLEAMRHLALHDPLTGLPNRALFLEQVSHVLARARRDRASVGTAVVFLDLDGFKGVNDRLGHVAGDRVLCVVAERLKACVREADLVARMGGDEFTILLEDSGDERAVTHVTDRIRDAVARAVDLGDGATAHVGVSIGVAIGLSRYRDPDLVLRHADAAMYRAKALGKGGVVFVRPDEDVPSEVWPRQARG